MHLVRQPGGRVHHTSLTMCCSNSCVHRIWTSCLRASEHPRCSNTRNFNASDKDMRSGKSSSNSTERASDLRRISDGETSSGDFVRKSAFNALLDPPVGADKSVPTDVLLFLCRSDFGNSECTVRPRNDLPSEKRSSNARLQLEV